MSVWLSSTQGAAVLAERDGSVQPAVLDPEVVEHPERLPGEPAELGVVPLALQFADDHERQDDVVLTEAGRRARVGEQDARVEDVRPAGFGRAAIGHRPSLGRRTNARLEGPAGGPEWGLVPAPLSQSDTSGPPG